MEEKLLKEFRDMCKHFYIINKGEFKCPYYYRLQGARDMLDAVKINYQDIENEFKSN